MSSSDVDVAGETVAGVGATVAPVRISRSGRTFGSGPDYDALAVVDPGHYVVTNEIARGGMGVIYRAHDRRLGRDVAIKEVLTSTGELARRFEREARITARLQHPSIVSVHEAGVWPSGEPFYAMKLVSGRSLDEAIAAAPTLAQRLALLPNVLAVADAMAYAHGQGVIHRDLKPRNVVVGEFGETVVIDWGLVKVLGRERASSQMEGSDEGGETTAGAILGTPAYMPPEQANADSVDERVDVYAIGAMLYHLFVGRAPYTADSSAELLAAVHTGPPRPVLELEPTLPKDLVAIVERAMARDPARRYPTARELADDLRRFQTGQLVGAHQYSLGQLLRRWLRRHRAIVAVVAVAVVVLAVGGGLAIRRILAAEQHADAERVIAVEQKGLAERNAMAAGELIHFMMFDLHTKLEHVGKLDLLDAVAQKSAAYYDERGDADPVALAKARESIGTVLEAKGDLDGALAEYKKGQASVATRADPKSRGMEARLLTRVAKIQVTRHDVAAGLASTEKALALLPPAADAETLRDEILVRGELLQIYDVQHEQDRGNEAAHAIAGLWERLAKADPTSLKAAVEARSRAAGRLADSKDLPGAIAELRADLAIAEAELAKQPTSAVWLELVRSLHADLGKQLVAAKDIEAALEEYRAELVVGERKLALDATSAVSRESVAHAHERLAQTLLRRAPRSRKDVAAAVLEDRTCLAIRADLSANDPTNALAKRVLAITYRNLGDALGTANDVKGAQAAYRASVALREAILALDPTSIQAHEDLVVGHIALAQAYGRKDNAHALAELRAAVAILLKDASEHPTAPTLQFNLATVEGTLADALVIAHDRAGAKAQLVAAIAITDRMAGADPEWKALGEELRRKLAAIH